MCVEVKNPFCKSGHICNYYAKLKENLTKEMIAHINSAIIMNFSVHKNDLLKIFPTCDNVTLML